MISSVPETGGHNPAAGLLHGETAVLHAFRAGLSGTDAFRTKPGAQPLPARLRGLQRRFSSLARIVRRSPPGTPECACAANQG
jgi:hypothetical protein